MEKLKSAVCLRRMFDRIGGRCMRVTLAQLNATVGDVVGNLNKLVEVFQANYGHSDLVVVPKLFLSGYPLHNTASQTWLSAAVKEAIAELLELSARFPDMGILLSAPTDEHIDAAHLIYKGEILKTIVKRDQVEIVPFLGETLGIA